MDDDPLDELARQPAGQVAAWMRRKAALADGVRPWTPIATPAAIDVSLEKYRRARGAATVHPGRKRLDIEHGEPIWDVIA